MYEKVFLRFLLVILLPSAFSHGFCNAGGIDNTTKNICVIGAGYVGLVTGACLAIQPESNVIVVENNKDRFGKLLKCEIPFYERGLQELVASGLSSKRLHFVSSIAEALSHRPQIIFSCVGTPPLSDGSADLSDVFGAAREIGEVLQDYCVVVSKSTVPVGTARKVKKIIQDQLKRRNVDIAFDVASNPEFLKEGDALDDFLHPDRVVVGTETLRARDLLHALYKPYLKAEDCFLSMNIESSELTKYASNAMLATRISFMNQLALFADAVGADVQAVRLGMAKDRRIGPYFLNAGIGYGGSCFPKDVKALIHTAHEHNCEMTILEEVERVNIAQRTWFINSILDFYGDSIQQKNVGIWGLSFKPGTDDIRLAPSIDVINALLAKRANVFVYDPQAQENVRKIFDKKISYAISAQQVLDSCDLLIILTEWSEFLSYKPESFLRLSDKVVFDGRNCFDPYEMNKVGLRYFTVGRNSVLFQ